jgi:hypothetical protein
MRIERNGAAERLTPRVERFLKECLGGVCQDEHQSPEQRRIDYVCRSGLLAVEIKTLEEDASERLGNLTDELRELEDWPMFYGAWPVDTILKNFADPEPIKLRLLNRLGRAIVTHLKKANKQLIAHASRFPRKNLVRVVILINEDHDVYSPEIVTRIVVHALRKHEAGKLMLGDIDGVLYFTERHATMINGQIAFPILHLQGPGVVSAPWKAEVISSALDRWSEFTQSVLNDADDVRQFETIEAVPDTMKRHEYWALGYRRQPYLEGYTQRQLRDLWDEVMVVSVLNFTTGSPLRHEHVATMRAMEKQTHLQQEMGARGLPLGAFAFDRDRFVAAGRRLNLPDHAIVWLATLSSEAAS